MDGSKNADVKAFVVNKGTGEVQGTINEGDMIVRKKSRQAFKRNKQQEAERLEVIMEWHLETFLKAYIPEIKLWMNELTQAEKSFLFSIMWCVSYEDCHLQYQNGVDIGTEDLIKITKMSRGLVYETIDSLIKKDILYKGRNSKNRQYFVNPWLFCRGNRVNKVLKTMFKNYKIRVHGGVKWKDLK